MKHYNKEKSNLPPLALWGGIECTVNRVHDTTHDQLEMTGHATRLNDLELFADLGITALRYPLLWERIAPAGLAKADWSWADQRLQRLRELNIDPIVSLLHHGCGPADTRLLDPLFPEKFAQYARAVAERYPWIPSYNPINEPLTTARFSGLYGHWHPHGRDCLTFARCLLAQCQAISLAMYEIRKVNPDAKLIQTEDIGKTFSTPHMQYQADFQNNRRWLTYDLLSGRVDRHHPLWEYLIDIGLGADDLLPFLHNPCPPDVLGIDYYVSSDRFLDEQLENYPPGLWGGNLRERYVDIDAVRARPEGIAGIGEILQEGWERYHIPLAVTEVHINCTVEEQIRWFYEVWKSAKQCRDTGIDVVAVTSWALLGAYDWDSLVTCLRGNYESGAYCLRDYVPYPTKLADMLKKISKEGKYDDPIVNSDGWWHRQERLITYKSQKNKSTATSRKN